jgi:chlorophyllase-like protein
VVRRIFLLGICFFLSYLNLNASDFSLWGNLEKGPYNIGFTTRSYTDYSRTYPAGDNVPAFRPVYRRIWYPTKLTKGAAVKYKDYFKFSSQSAPTDFEQKLSEEQLEGSKEYLLHGLDRDNPDVKKSLKKFLATNTAAFFDATPASGSFPLVIYHPGLGGTVDDNSVMCEFLASHGYTVVTSPFISEDGNDLRVDWDLERSGNDISFIINKLAQESFVDLENVALMGQSYGGQAAITYPGKENSIIDAIISLDATIEEGPIDSENLPDAVVWKLFWQAIRLLSMIYMTGLFTRTVIIKHVAGLPTPI